MTRKTRDCGQFLNEIFKWTGKVQTLKEGYHKLEVTKDTCEVFELYSNMHDS